MCARSVVVDQRPLQVLQVPGLQILTVEIVQVRLDVNCSSWPHKKRCYSQTMPRRSE